MVAYYNARIKKSETALGKVRGEISYLEEMRDNLQADIDLSAQNRDAWIAAHPDEVGGGAADDTNELEQLENGESSE